MQFSRMHGLGNDFIIIDAITQDVFLSSKLIRRLADRKNGIGFDQLLIVEPPCEPNLDFHYRIFNANGKEVSQCGNGARCFAHFVYLKKLTYKRSIHISTVNRRMILNIIDDTLVQVNMGEPNFNPFLVPFKANKIKKIYILNISNQIISCGIVSMGNPHCVIRVDNVKTVDVESLGSVLENHNAFPEGANISFMQVIKHNYIRLRVYERGVGETQSCGSGACAAVAVGINQGLLTKKVCVELLGGRLNITWKGSGYSLYMTGSTTYICDEVFYL